MNQHVWREFANASGRLLGADAQVDPHHLLVGQETEARRIARRWPAPKPPTEQGLGFERRMQEGIQLVEHATVLSPGTP